MPTLAQYDPTGRLFECVDGDLVFSASRTMPLVRYAIGDRGGLLDTRSVIQLCARYGWQPPAGYDELPMVYLFGRTLFSVSYLGANVYPENVAPVLEQPAFANAVTGKFVLQVWEKGEETYLFVLIELVPESRTVSRKPNCPASWPLRSASGWHPSTASIRSMSPPIGGTREWNCGSTKTRNGSRSG